MQLVLAAPVYERLLEQVRRAQEEFDRAASAIEAQREAMREWAGWVLSRLIAAGWRPGEAQQWFNEAVRVVDRWYRDAREKLARSAEEYARRLLEWARRAEEEYEKRLVERVAEAAEKAARETFVPPASVDSALQQLRDQLVESVSRIVPPQRARRIVEEALRRADIRSILERNSRVYEEVARDIARIFEEARERVARGEDIDSVRRWVLGELRRAVSRIGGRVAEKIYEDAVKAFDEWAGRVRRVLEAFREVREAALRAYQRLLELAGRARSQDEVNRVVEEYNAVRKRVEGLVPQDVLRKLDALVYPLAGAINVTISMTRDPERVVLGGLSPAIERLRSSLESILGSTPLDPDTKRKIVEFLVGRARSAIVRAVLDRLSGKPPATLFCWRGSGSITCEIVTRDRIAGTVTVPGEKLDTDNLLKLLWLTAGAGYSVERVASNGRESYAIYVFDSREDAERALDQWLREHNPYAYMARLAWRALHWEGGVDPGSIMRNLEEFVNMVTEFYAIPAERLGELGARIGGLEGALLQLLSGVAGLGVGAIEGALYTIAAPLALKQMAELVSTAIGNPGALAKALTAQVSTPAGLGRLLGNLIGGEVALRGLGGILEHLPRIERIPTLEGFGLRLRVGSKTVAYLLRGKGETRIGLGSPAKEVLYGRLRFASPEVNVSGLYRTIADIEETAEFLENAARGRFGPRIGADIESARILRRLEELLVRGRELLREAKRVSREAAKRWERSYLEESYVSQRLGREAAEAVLERLREAKPRIREIYGSQTIKAALGEEFSRIPGDIDVMLKSGGVVELVKRVLRRLGARVETGEELARRLAREIAEEINKRLGRRAVVARGSKVVDAETGKVIVDIHYAGERPALSVSLGGRRVFTIDLRELPVYKTESGLPVRGLEYQLLSKTEATMGPHVARAGEAARVAEATRGRAPSAFIEWLERELRGRSEYYYLGPAAYRAKDVQDLLEMLKYLSRRLGGRYDEVVEELRRFFCTRGWIPCDWEPRGDLTPREAAELAARLRGNPLWRALESIASSAGSAPPAVASLAAALSTLIRAARLAELGSPQAPAAESQPGVHPGSVSTPVSIPGPSVGGGPASPPPATVSGGTVAAPSPRVPAAAGTPRPVKPKPPGPPRPPRAEPPAATPSPPPGPVKEKPPAPSIPSPQPSPPAPPGSPPQPRTPQPSPPSPTQPSPTPTPPAPPGSPPNPPNREGPPAPPVPSPPPSPPPGPRTQQPSPPPPSPPSPPGSPPRPRIQPWEQPWEEETGWERRGGRTTKKGEMHREIYTLT